MLVTGGAGFIGSHLAEALLNKGCEIRMVDNLSTGFMQNVHHLLDCGKASLIQGDIREYQTCRKAAERVDLIFHEAAQINPAAAVKDALADFEVNARGTLNMLDAARKEDVEKFVFASTNVYGNPRYLPIDEDHPVDLLSPYAAAKLSGEAYCIVYSNTYGMDTVRLRYTNVYGPRQRATKSKSGVIPIFIERVLKEQPPVIYGTGEQTRDFIYVSDVVEANILVAENDECNGEVYNVGCGKEISIKQVAEQVIRTAGMRNLKPEYSPARVADFHRCAVDLKKIREATGFKPRVPFQEGLQRTIDWWRNSS